MEAAILIGLDFGTTYSGVAWAYSQDPDNIGIVTNWDSVEYGCRDQEKAPTEILYPALSLQELSLENGLGTKDDIHWGYGISPGEEAVKWFKLLLLDEEDMKEEIRNSLQILRARDLLSRVGKSATEAVADYLGRLWHHSINKIKEEMGESAVEATPFRVVITVPAVWTHKAVRRTRQAAVSAGILSHRTCGDTTLHFVSEPEAAALATFHDMKRRPNFESGDSVVVCDAGGGTVDLISYTIVQSNPFELRECVEGQGRLCGAIFLDQDFEALVEQILGEELWSRISPAQRKRMMIQDWENGIKRAFDGSERTWTLTLPYDVVAGIQGPTVRLSRGHVQEIFENVISQIRALINDQIRRILSKEGRNPKAVVLVGGFGCCQYLFELLKSENAVRDIQVLKSSGNRPSTAICRGAVLKALTDTNLPGVKISSRISRLSYGKAYNAPFDEGLHDPQDRFVSEFDRQTLARGQMEWVLKRGDDIWDKDPVKLIYNRHVTERHLTSAMIYNFSDIIYICDLSNPPSRLSPEVQALCKIRAEFDLSNVPVQQSPEGFAFRRVEYFLEIQICGSVLEYSVCFEGKKTRQKSVEVEFERSGFRTRRSRPNLNTSPVHPEMQTTPTEHEREAPGNPPQRSGGLATQADLASNTNGQVKALKRRSKIHVSGAPSIPKWVRSGKPSTSSPPGKDTSSMVEKSS